jgi:hypothetical protein
VRCAEEIVLPRRRPARTDKTAVYQACAVERPLLYTTAESFFKGPLSVSPQKLTDAKTIEYCS